MYSETLDTRSTSYPNLHLEMYSETLDTRSTSYPNLHLETGHIRY